MAALKRCAESRSRHGLPSAVGFMCVAASICSLCTPHRTPAPASHWHHWRTPRPNGWAVGSRTLVSSARSLGQWRGRFAGAARRRSDPISGQHGRGQACADSDVARCSAHSWCRGARRRAKLGPLLAGPHACRSHRLHTSESARWTRRPSPHRRLRSAGVSRSRIAAFVDADQ